MGEMIEVAKAAFNFLSLRFLPEPFLLPTIVGYGRVGNGKYLASYCRYPFIFEMRAPKKKDLAPMDDVSSFFYGY